MWSLILGGQISAMEGRVCLLFQQKPNPICSREAAPRAGRAYLHNQDFSLPLPIVYVCMYMMRVWVKGCAEDRRLFPRQCRLLQGAPTVFPPFMESISGEVHLSDGRIQNLLLWRPWDAYLTLWAPSIRGAWAICVYNAGSQLGILQRLPELAPLAALRLWQMTRNFPGTPLIYVGSLLFMPMWSKGFWKAGCRAW